MPTPIDRYKRPDLTRLEKASETLGALLQPGDVVIFESTVYPGATDEVCVPILERLSGLTYATATVGAQPTGRTDPEISSQPRYRREGRAPSALVKAHT